MSDQDEPQPMTGDQLSVAELLYDISRDPPAIRWLLGRRRHQLLATVEEIVDDLISARYVERIPDTNQVRLTDTGRKSIWIGQEWEFEVEEIFDLPNLAPKPMLRGRIRRGVVRPGDGFRSSAAIIGRVEGIEDVRRPDLAHDGVIVLRVDTDGHTEGEVLARHEWMIEPG